MGEENTGGATRAGSDMRTVKNFQGEWGLTLLSNQEDLAKMPTHVANIEGQEISTHSDVLSNTVGGKDIGTTRSAQIQKDHQRDMKFSNPSSHMDTVRRKKRRPSVAQANSLATQHLSMGMNMDNSNPLPIHPKPKKFFMTDDEIRKKTQSFEDDDLRKRLIWGEGTSLRSWLFGRHDPINNISGGDTNRPYVHLCVQLLYILLLCTGWLFVLGVVTQLVAREWMCIRLRVHLQQLKCRIFSFLGKRPHSRGHAYVHPRTSTSHYSRHVHSR